MNEFEQLEYLKNLITIAHCDSASSATRQALIEASRKEIGAKKSLIEVAHKAVQIGQHSLTPVGSFATKIRNFDDMLRIAAIDQNMTETGQNLLLKFGTDIGLTDSQFRVMLHEAQEAVTQTSIEIACSTCGTHVSNATKFCPNCGAPAAGAQAPSAIQPLTPQPSGWTIEFSESTAAAFPAALKVAQTAAAFSSRVENKKAWYSANWPLNEFENAVKLAKELSGIRNRRCYLDGAQMSWDEVFGFAWCASSRQDAYRPNEFCFGKSESRINPWGCIRGNMDWSDWSPWLSYGRFEKAGFLNRVNVWVFDKQRIEHELMTNLHKVRYCPYLSFAFVERVLANLPDRVNMPQNDDWKYNHTYDDSADGVKIIEVEKHDGYEFKNEYTAFGIRPKNLNLIRAVIRKSLSEAGLAERDPNI